MIVLRKEKDYLNLLSIKSNYRHLTFSFELIYYDDEIWFSLFRSFIFNNHQNQLHGLID
jgi:hypothetical protein